MAERDMESNPQGIVAAVGTASGAGSAAAIGSTLHPLPDDHPFYAKIGKVAAEWARLEHALDLIIWNLVGTDNRLLAAVTAQMNGQHQRFMTIEALAAAKGFDSDMLTRIQQLRNRTGQVSKLRNRFVHDAWFIEAGTLDVAQFKSFSIKERAFGFKAISDEDVRDALESIRKKLKEVICLKNDLLLGPNT